MNFNRRELGSLLCTMPAVASGEQANTVQLRNDELRIVLAVDRGRIARRQIENRRTGERIDLPLQLFSLEFQEGRKTGSSDFRAKVASQASTGFELLFDSPAEGVQVRIQYELGPGKAYARKRMQLRRTDGTTKRLMAVELEDWRGVRRNWRSMTADPMKCGSHPIFCDTWWAGVEFISALNEYSDDGFLLRSRPGGIRIASDWVTLRSTVVGTTAANGARRTFLKYIDDVRLAPPRFAACYNAWWTLPKVITERDSRMLLEELKAKLFDRHGTFFDFVTMDMGWSHPRSIWEIDRTVLPDRFDNHRRIIEPAGAKLGLWMSPSEMYPPVCDYEWAEKNGYAVLMQPQLGAGQTRAAVSLADPKYRSETKAALSKLIRENGVAQIKYDGLIAREEKPHHDLLPGDDSAEPLAEYALELLRVSKEANPELVTEPTFLNSHINYISPWMLKYSDSLWGNTSDCPLGIGPAPEYRESHTNAREYLIFASLNEVWVPQNAVQYFDIIHVDSKGGFPNHAAMAVGRGRFFLATYINPKMLSEEDWRIYAGLLNWARKNQDLLRQTEVVTSNVEKGEPYIYAHWLGTRGVLVVRNPSNATQAFSVDLRRTGAPPELRDAVCYSQYPYRRGIATGISNTSSVSLQLAPWELLFLEVVPRASLKEAVAIGARWYHEPQATAVVPDAGVDHVRILKPGGGEETMAVKSVPRPAASVAVLSKSIRPMPEAEWLTHRPAARPYFPFHYPVEPGSAAEQTLRAEALEQAKPETVPTCAFEFTFEVNVPAEVHRSKLLLLVEFPGRRFCPSECQATINGATVQLESSNSSNHTGFFVARPNNAWKDMAQFESQWCWYICEVKPGQRNVTFTGKAGHKEPHFRAWTWTTHDLSSSKLRTAIVGSQPAMPQYEPEYEHAGLPITL